VVAEADATAFEATALFGASSFDRVFISYALSMIPAWRAALRAASGAVGPGGRLLVVDFGDQHGWPRWFKSLLRAWLRRFSVNPRAELADALREIAAENGGTLRFAQPYRGYAAFAVLDKP
jgi:S-adenosylmethionine-diacylgycerolhomoserine-N-methlytransferase